MNGTVQLVVPVLAAVVSALIFFIGLRSMMSLPIRQFPDLESASISISTTYPGAAPSLMQGFITTPIKVEDLIDNSYLPHGR